MGVIHHEKRLTFQTRRRKVLEQDSSRSARPQALGVALGKGVGEDANAGDGQVHALGAGG